MPPGPVNVSGVPTQTGPLLLAVATGKALTVIVTGVRLLLLQFVVVFLASA